MAVYTLFGQPATPATLTTDTGQYAMGVQFTTSQAGTLTGIWFYSAPGAGYLPTSIALYQVIGAGTLIHSETPTWSGAAGSGWVRAGFATPPSLSTSTNYKAVIFLGGGSNAYSSTAHYWDTGPGISGISNGPLSAPNNAGADGGQDSFVANPGGMAYPNTSFNASNYWIDPEITVTTGTVNVSDVAGAVDTVSVTVSVSVSDYAGAVDTGVTTISISVSDFAAGLDTFLTPNSAGNRYLPAIVLVAETWTGA